MYMDGGELTAKMGGSPQYVINNPISDSFSNYPVLHSMYWYCKQKKISGAQQPKKVVSISRDTGKSRYNVSQQRQDGMPEIHGKNSSKAETSWEKV
jgi:hypothetical protein